ncbi:hypothetical protein HRbin19_00936 [bacterium HR19]|nr:hypothetical protein HRbin19_00936 [bacterium HR19]
MEGTKMEILIDEKAKENGLATMLYQMIKENIERNPWKETNAKKINSDVFIWAKDADVKVSISFRKDKVLVFDGEIFNPSIKIKGDTSDLIEMTKIKILPVLKIPVLDKETLPILQKIIKRRVEIKFDIKKIPSLINLIVVLSIYPV